MTGKEDAVTTGHLFGFRAGQVVKQGERLMLLELLHRPKPTDPDTSKRSLRLSIEPKVAIELAKLLQQVAATPQSSSRTKQ